MSRRSCLRLSVSLWGCTTKRDLVEPITSTSSMNSPSESKSYPIPRLAGKKRVMFSCEHLAWTINLGEKRPSSAGKNGHNAIKWLYLLNSITKQVTLEQVVPVAKLIY